MGSVVYTFAWLQKTVASMTIKSAHAIGRGDTIEQLRPGYQARLRAHRDALSQIARHTGWTYLLHVTDKPPEHALLSLYEALEHGRQRMLR